MIKKHADPTISEHYIYDYMLVILIKHLIVFNYSNDYFCR